MIVTTVFSRVRNPILSILAELLRDTNFSESIVYQKFVSQVFDSSEGHNVDTFKSYRVSGVRMRHNEESIRVMSSDVQVGDVLFILRHQDLPSDFSLKDRIEDSAGKVLSIKGIDTAFDLAAFITVQV